MGLLWKQFRNWLGRGGNDLRNSFVLQLASGRKLVLQAGMQLTVRDIPGLTPQVPGLVVAQVSMHPQNPSVLGLQNLSTTAWVLSQAGGDRRRVEPGRSVKLADGTQIDFGNGTVVIRLTKASRSPRTRVAPPMPIPAVPACSPAKENGAPKLAARRMELLAKRASRAESKGRSRHWFVWSCAVLSVVALGVWGISALWNPGQVPPGLFPWAMSAGADSGVEITNISPQQPLADGELRMRLALTRQTDGLQQFHYRVVGAADWQAIRDGSIRLLDLKAGLLTVEVGVKQSGSIREQSPAAVGRCCQLRNAMISQT